MAHFFKKIVLHACKGNQRYSFESNTKHFFGSNTVGCNENMQRLEWDEMRLNLKKIDVLRIFPNLLNFFKNICTY